MINPFFKNKGACFSLGFGIEKVNSINFKDNEIENLKEILDFNKKIILVTGHRRENHGEGLLNICSALKQIAENNKETQIISLLKMY